MSFSRHSHPMVRYAVCHAVGLIAVEDPFFFKRTFGPALLQELFLILKYDPIPRVVSHAAAALTNLLEGMSYSHFSPYIEELTNTLLHHAYFGISIVQQTCLVNL
jgi:importin-5